MPRHYLRCSVRKMGDIGDSGDVTADTLTGKHIDPARDHQVPSHVTSVEEHFEKCGLLNRRITMSKHTKESAVGILSRNGISCMEREVVAPTLIEQAADKLLGKKRIERIVSIYKTKPGIGLWGVIDYLVHNHKFVVVWR